MEPTIKATVSEVRATELALIAAVIGPKTNPSKAVESAMRFYLQAAVELDHIKGHHIVSLLHHYFRREETDALLKKWRQLHPMEPQLPPDEASQVLKHYPGKEPHKDEVWQFMNRAVPMGKRAGAVLQSLKQFRKANRDFQFWDLQKKKDDCGEWFYPIGEMMLSAWSAFAHDKREASKKQAAERARRFRAKRLSNSKKGKNVRN